MWCFGDNVVLPTGKFSSHESPIYYVTGQTNSVLLYLRDQFLLLGEQKEVNVDRLFEVPRLEDDLVAIRVVREGHGRRCPLLDNVRDVIATDSGPVQHCRVGGVAGIDALERDCQ